MLPRSGRHAPLMRAASAAAPPGSATMRSVFHNARWDSRIASSVTSTVRATCFWASGNMSAPTRFGASESAAMPPAGASTGSPASSARVSVGAASGSTPITGTRPAYHAAMPPIRPPPPTATRSASSFGACSSSSTPTVACPCNVSY